MTLRSVSIKYNHIWKNVLADLFISESPTFAEMCEILLNKRETYSECASLMRDVRDLECLRVHRILFHIKLRLCENMHFTPKCNCLFYSDTKVIKKMKRYKFKLKSQLSFKYQITS